MGMNSSCGYAQKSGFVAKPFNADDLKSKIDISHTKEVTQMIPIRSIPQSPPYLKGVINLRDKVIPVMDLGLKFEMEAVEYSERTCIIILEFQIDGKDLQMGITVDSVSEVLDVSVSDIEQSPFSGTGLDTNYILAMAKAEDRVKILLDTENLLGSEESAFLENAA